MRAAMHAAVLTCLAWALLPLRLSQADQGLQSAADESGLIAASADDPETLPPRESLSPAPSEETSGGLTILNPPSTSEETSAGVGPVWKRMRQWTPQGMIPYLGPRTPDSEKDRGIGQPLEGRGWRTQPFSIGTFAAVTDGGALIPGHVNQQPSFYGGLNIGWDYDHFWGIEKRLGFGALNLTNGNHDSIPGTGVSVTGEYRLMYYPLGDARWRPFATAGVGWSDFYFNDDQGARHLDTVGMIPFGIGMKYLWSERIAVRVDLIDEMTFGDGALANFHYVALAAGLEIRYGHRLIHMPWHRKSTAGD